MAKKIITRLEKLRRSKGMSRPKLAEISGVPMRMIVQYEDGPRRVTSAWYFAFLSKALECSIFDILEPVEGSKFGQLKIEKEKKTFDDKIEQLKNCVNLMKNTIDELEKFKYAK